MNIHEFDLKLVKTEIKEEEEAFLEQFVIKREIADGEHRTCLKCPIRQNYRQCHQCHHYPQTFNQSILQLMVFLL